MAAPQFPINPGDYMLYPNYPGTDSPALSSIPYLIPPYVLNRFYPNTIQVAINNVFGANFANSNQLCPPAQFPQTDFVFTWNNTVAQVLIQPTNVWQVNPTARQTLANSFAMFCTWLDCLESQGCLARGGALVISQRVAQAMPLSISETLAYFYGFNSQSGYIDIQPGMRLRVEFESYDFVSNINPNLNSFVGNGASYYYVCSQLSSAGVPVLAFDAFMGANRPPAVFRTSAGAGGIIDLQAKGNQRRYYRLFYPTNMGSSTVTPSISTTQNPTLIGANTLADLAAATKQYLQNGTCPAGTTTLCTFFNGRAAVIPEVLVNIGGIQSGVQNFNGQPIYVPIGTTLRNLVERMATLPGNTGNILIQRLFTATQPGGGNDPAPIQQQPQYQQAEFIPTKVQGMPFTLDVFDLPIAKGDIFSLIGLPLQ